ncbi:IS630 family transposase [Deinococcus wulumuqiensis R12]|nr:IS630 family transposase [Deinococcus wulumuqiensis]QII20354.1 IS630 family transposase [Deinococcus wulumuqiensis R12]
MPTSSLNALVSKRRIAPLIASSDGMGSPIKKTLVASERNEELRTQFQGDISAVLPTPAKLVFLDECGFNTALTRLYGRAPSHQRATGQTPRNWGKNQTLICALQASGPFAPLVIEGAVNGTIFEWYIREVLCPALTPGQVVVLDNLSAHHRASVKQLIEERGCTLLFLPPYSPDFNPIEMMFSKLKALIRAGQWREVHLLIEAIGLALSQVSLKDIFGWFTHVYRSISFCQML